MSLAHLAVDTAEVRCNIEVFYLLRFWIDNSRQKYRDFLNMFWATLEMLISICSSPTNVNDNQSKKEKMSIVLSCLMIVETFFKFVTQSIEEENLEDSEADKNSK